MTLIVDAWLEKNEPFIRFIDADTASEFPGYQRQASCPGAGNGGDLPGRTQP